MQLFRTQFALDFSNEIIVDYFAGGGGASTGLEIGLQRPVAIAKNHNPAALSMHEANHPHACHIQTDVFKGDPLDETGGRPVGWFHMSPDCTDHSQAAGGQPRKKEIRNLSWVGLKWGGIVRPRVISLENVKQILKWGPLIAKRCSVTSRVITLEKVRCEITGRMINRVAAKGERVPVQNQFLIPDPKRAGKSWRKFVSSLQSMGYTVDWRIICAADFGAPTTRSRLFMLARCDGQSIVWPESDHAKKRDKKKKAWRSASECIDFSIPCPSIFNRKKPLADATLRRIARGMKRYVIDSNQPFIVPVTHSGSDRVHSCGDPLRTVTAAHRGEFMLASPALIQACHGERRPGDGRSSHNLVDPVGTIHAGGGSYAISSATLIQSGYGERIGQAPRCLDIEAPLGTIVGLNTKHALASAHLVKFRFDSDGAPINEPLPTITSGGHTTRPAGAAHAMGIATAFLAQMNNHRGVEPSHGRSIAAPMSTVTNSGSQQQLVTAHLASLYSDSTGDRAHSAEVPIPTITASPRHALVATHLAHLRGNCDARNIDEPLRTISAGGEHHCVIEYTLSQEHEEGALRVAAFLIRYYSEGGQWGDLHDPLATMTTKDRLALVTVTISGTPYVIVDIGLRMLTPRELYRAQGFPDDYIIEFGHDGRRFTKSEQVHMCGNSVSPPPMAAIARANNPWAFQVQEAAA